MTPLTRFGFCTDSLSRGHPSGVPFLVMLDFTPVRVDMLILLPYNFLMEFIQDSTVD